MRKVIGIGETILDIIFRNEQPVAAVPGGSTFNGVISLGRCGVPVSMITEIGNDHVGNNIINFMKENGVGTEYVSVYPEGKSPISLAFLDENNDANYSFYKDYDKNNFELVLPEINPDDIVMFGSYFVINPVLRPKTLQFLQYAYERGAILYYDINYRANHKDEFVRLQSSILENMEMCSVFRGSADDFDVMYGMHDADRLFDEKLKFHVPCFICTNAGKSVSLRTANFSGEYDVKQVETVSTIGAGDNFNAGFIYGLIKYNVRKNDLQNLSAEQWKNLIGCATDFSAEVCQSVNNSVSKEFGESHRL